MSEPTKASRRLRALAVVVPLAAAALVTASRVPLWQSHPDWGPFLLNEHCFVLTAPAVFDDRRAVDPDTPYWIVNPEQMRLHYHMGSLWMFHAVRLLHDVLQQRSLLLIKLLGTLGAALYAGMLVWALIQLRGLRQGTTLALPPLFLAAFPPSMFLWFSLIPQGHYSDTHVFYALMLPVYVQLARRTAGRNWLMAAGLIGGTAVAYTASNVLLVAVAVAGHLLWGDAAWRRRLLETCWLGVPFVATYALFGRVGSLVDRMQETTLLVASQDPGAPIADVKWLDGLRQAVPEHVIRLGGDAGYNGWVSATAEQRTLAYVAMAFLLTGALAVVAHVVRPRWFARSRRDPFVRFVALHGWLLLAFVAAYLAVAPYFPPHGHPIFIYYLLPIYPSVFLGIGALAYKVARSSPPAGLAVVVVLVALGALQLSFWRSAIQQNDRLDECPDHRACDSFYLEGYFWDHDREGDLGGSGSIPSQLAVLLDVPGGERRCSASVRQWNGECAFVGFVLQALLDDGAPGCADEPTPERRRLCARAAGAVHYAEVFATEDDLRRPVPRPDHCAEAFEGDLYWSCLTGVYTGATVDAGHRYYVNSMGLQSNLEVLCGTSFDDPGVHRTCLEQTAYLALGAPEPPRPTSDELPAPCGRWPVAYQGLCERTLALSDTDSASSCQDVFSERFAEDLPREWELAYDSCLALNSDLYPYCAIGVARLRGELACSWSAEEPGSEVP